MHTIFLFEAGFCHHGFSLGLCYPAQCTQLKKKKGYELKCELKISLLFVSPMRADCKIAFGFITC